MSNSNTCNCSSWHVTLVFWNALRDHLLELGTAICFDRRCKVDSSTEKVISLASAISLTTLQLS
ncbi:hypothetical protein DAI22_08g244700 [Oryza sativa Japonica Group]|nr:hypothetical protein DAI22_08g244700 [Oryza sativa Japonica Group]